MANFEKVYPNIKVDAWEKEAKKRGLSNHKTTPAALKAKVSKKALDLFKDLNVMVVSWIIFPN